MTNSEPRLRVADSCRFSALHLPRVRMRARKTVNLNFPQPSATCNRGERVHSKGRTMTNDTKDQAVSDRRSKYVNRPGRDSATRPGPR